MTTKSPADSCLSHYNTLKTQQLSLDLTRGKPSSEQLALSHEMDLSIKDKHIFNGTDIRNYGGLEGLTEMRQFFAKMANIPADNIIVGGNSSLTLMHQCVMMAMVFGLGTHSAWSSQNNEPTFICPAPGYDRHFSICQHFGIKMLTVGMNDNGPDMDAIEKLIETQPGIRGLWCVPRFSNPTGAVYSNDVLERLAKLAKNAHPSFKIFYDNAYCVHELHSNAASIRPIEPILSKHGTQESLIHFGSTSKITLAGAGVAFVSAGPETTASIKHHLSHITVGPDKINQARHLNFLKDKNQLLKHMNKHAQILKPKFDCVINKLKTAFNDSQYTDWTLPDGGYFVSLNVKPGLAKTVIKLAGEAGVKLTPAGATFPYGIDPLDSNIRIAPTMPPLEEVAQAMDVLIASIRLAEQQ